MAVKFLKTSGAVRSPGKQLVPCNGVLKRQEQGKVSPLKKKKKKSLPNTDHVDKIIASTLKSVTDIKRRKLLEKRLRSLKSTFKYDVVSLQDALDKDDITRVVREFQKQSLRTLFELLPITEHNFRSKAGSEHAAYAYNAVVSSIREQLAELRENQSAEEVIEVIISSVLRPAFMDLLDACLSYTSVIHKDIKEYVPEKHHSGLKNMLDNHSTRLARELQKAYRGMAKKIDEQIRESF